MNEQLKKTLIEILNRNHDDKQHILSDCHCDDGIICHEIQLSEIIENIPTHDYILNTWLDDTRPLTDHFHHMAMGLSSEVGEFIGLVDKQTFKPSKGVTRQMMLDELGDVAYYVLVWCHLLQIDFDDLVKMNAEKLQDGHGWTK